MVLQGLHQLSSPCGQVSLNLLVRCVDEVAPEDWDVVATTTPLYRYPPTLFVVAAFDYGELAKPEGDVNRAVRARHATRSVPLSVAAQFLRPDDIPDPFAPLIGELIEIASNEDDHSCVVAGGERLAAFGGTTSAQGATRELVKPLLLASDGRVLAGIYAVAGGTGEVLTLPGGVSLGRWVEAAIAYWGATEPVRFPTRTADWRRHPEWETIGERQAREGLEKIQEERRTVLAKYEQLVADHQASLDQARALADSAERVLLTGSGDVLKVQVMLVLQDIGFSVEDMDERWPINDRREDLRVSDGSDWEAVVEVKGYARAGTKAGDLISLSGRFARRYENEAGHPPSALWYAVNRMYDNPPDQRPTSAGVEAGDLEAFAAENGLIIDTVSLFRLGRDVADSTIAREAARKLLQTAIGYFDYPAASTG